MTKDKLLKIFIIFGLIFMQFSTFNIDKEQEVEATTEFFGDVQNVWMGSLYSSIMIQPNGELYSTSGDATWDAQVGLATAGREWEKTRFHQNPYGLDEDFIDYAKSRYIGWLLTDKGTVYYSSSSNGATDAWLVPGILGETSFGERHETSVDDDKIQTRNLANQFKLYTNSSFLKHDLLTDFSSKSKIVDIDGAASALVFLDENNRLWGIGGGYENTTYDNLLGYGAAGNATAGSTINKTETVGGETYEGVKLLAENVEEFTMSWTDSQNLARSTLWFKTGGQWYATGDNSDSKSFTTSTSAYITNAEFDSNITMSTGATMVGRKVDLTSLNTEHGTSYTQSDIVQIEGYGRSSAMLMNDGKVYLVGRGEYGSFGDKDGNNITLSTTPQEQVLFASSQYQTDVGTGWNKVVELFPGAHVMFIKTESGRIWAQGSNDGGDLGFQRAGNPNEYRFTEITDPENTGLMTAALQKSPDMVNDAVKIEASWNASILEDVNGYILSSGPRTGHSGGDQFEFPALNGFGFSRVKRDNRVVRIPTIIIDDDTSPMLWEILSDPAKTMQIGLATRYIDGSTTDYPTFAEYRIYGCKENPGDPNFTSQDINNCTYEVTGKNNFIASNTNTSNEHAANKIDDTDLYEVDIDSLNLEGGFYKIIAKRYAFIGPNGSGTSRQYNEDGTDATYFFEISVDPILNVPAITQINVGDTWDRESGVSATNSRSEVVNFGSGTYDIKASGIVNTTMSGVYIKTYTMLDEYTGATTSKDRIVVVKDDDSYVDSDGFIDADIKEYTVDQAKALTSEQELLDDMNANAADINTGKDLVPVFDSASSAKFSDINNGVVGIYPMTVQASETLTSGSAFTPTVTRLVIVNDGSIKTGTKYAIQAYDFDIAFQQYDDTDAFFKGPLAGNISVYDLASGADVTGTADVRVDKGTWTNVENTSHTITFTVYDTDGVTVDVETTVEGYIDSVPHIYFSPTVLEIAEGSATSDSYKQGVTATDFESGVDVDITDRVTLTGAITDLTTLTSGIYTVTYSVTDDSSNNVTEDRVVVINDGTYGVGNDYIIEAADFTVRPSEVDTTNQGIFDATTIKVYDATDASDVTSGVTLIYDKGGYEDTLGTYNLNVKVGEDTTANTDFVAEVVNGDSPVLTFSPTIEYTISGGTITYDPLDGVTVSDTEDDANGYSTVVTTSPILTNTTPEGIYKVTYTATDEDGNQTTKDRVVIVNDGNIVTGSNFFIQAYDFEIRIGQVDISSTENKEAQIINESALKIYDINGELVYDDVHNIDTGVITDIDISYPSDEYSNVENTYSIEITANSDASITIEADVIKGDDPVLTVTPTYEEISVGATYDELSGVSANDTEDNDITGNIEVTGAVDENTVGVYSIDYKITDSDGNIDEATRVVVVNDGSLVAGSTYIIQAEDINVRVSEVDTTDSGIIADSNAKVYDKLTGDELTIGSAPDIPVTVNSGSYVASEGIYSDVVLTVTSDSAATKTITANVTAGDPPVLTVNPLFVEVTVGATYDVTTGVSVTDTEDTDINVTDDVTITGSVNTAVAGLYKIDYTATDSDGNTDEATRVVLVNDGTYEVGTNYIMKADDVTLRVSEVDTVDPDTQLKSLSSYEVFDKLTTLPNTTVTVDISYGNPVYTDIVGVYDFTLSITGDVSAAREANVITGDVPVVEVLDDLVEVAVADLATFDIYDNVNISDTEDIFADLVITTNPVINTSTQPGVYKVEISAEDTDGNIGTGNKVVLVNDGTFVAGNDYIMKANDFIVAYSKWTDEAIKLVELSAVELYEVSSGQEVSDLSIVKVDTSSWQQQEGYTTNMTFSVAPKTRAPGDDVEVTVIASIDHLPVYDFSEDTIEFTTLNPTDSDVINAVNDFTVTDVEDGDITNITVVSYPNASDIKIGEMYSVVYEVEDSNGNVVTVSRAMFIDEGSFIRVGDYFLNANDFSMLLSEYDTSVENIANLSGLKIYDLGGNEVPLSQASDLITDVSQVEKKGGTYEIKFTSATGPGNLIINVTIVDDLPDGGFNNISLLVIVMLLWISLVLRKLYKDIRQV